MNTCPHCNTEIDEHEASRCLDAWVAEAVMGWKRIDTLYGGPVAEGWWGYWTGEWFKWIECPESDERDAAKPWSPSTSIASAWLVVEKAKICYLYSWMTKDENGWDAITPDSRGRGDTAPLAICKASIKAVEK